MSDLISREAAVARAEHQDWEKARARASSWNAGGVLEGLMLAFDTDGDAYVLPSNIEGNLVALPARDDNGEILNPEIWLAMVLRFNAYPALTAENNRLRDALQTIVDSYEATHELHTSHADCAANLYDHARFTLIGEQK